MASLEIWLYIYKTYLSDPYARKSVTCFPSGFDANSDEISKLQSKPLNCWVFLYRRSLNTVLSKTSSIFFSDYDIVNYKNKKKPTTITG